LVAKNHYLNFLVAKNVAGGESSRAKGSRVECQRGWLSSLWQFILPDASDRVRDESGERRVERQEPEQEWLETLSS
jgi:hypothetical protein